MHYKKSEISGGEVFTGLRGELGGQAWNVPALGKTSDVLFMELGQLSGGMMAGFSHSISATFGAKPWKVRSLEENGLFSADAIIENIQSAAEDYFKQMVRSQIGPASPLRGKSGGVSGGQSMADFAAFFSRAVSRNG